MHVQQMRSAAAACLPRLPGPKQAAADGGRGGPGEPCCEPTGGGGALGWETTGGGDGVLGREPPRCFQAYQLPDITRTADILVVAVG